MRRRRLDVAGLAAGSEDDRLADPVVALDPLGKRQMIGDPARLGGRPGGDLAEMEDAETVQHLLVLLANAANALEVVRHAVARRRKPDRAHRR